MSPTRYSITLFPRIAALSLAAFVTLATLGSVDSLATSEHSITAAQQAQARQAQQQMVRVSNTAAPRS